MFSDPIELKWEIPIMILITTDYDWTLLEDTWLEKRGFFCDELQFWYFVECREDIQKRNLTAEIRHSELIFINCIEFVIIIISYNAILDAIKLLVKL